MSDGGFLVKFIAGDGSVEECRCHAVSFDYDKHEYTVNNEETKKIPAMVKIEVIPEDGSEWLREE